MKKTLLAVTLSIALLGVGCGGGGSGVNIKAELQKCLGDGTTFLFGLVSTFSILQSAITDDTLDKFDNLTATPVAGMANTWDFTYSIDGNADATNGTDLSGRIVFSADPTDGVDPGDTAMLTFTLSGSEGYGGAATLDIEFQPNNNITVSGSGDIDMPGACSFQYDVDKSSPMSFGIGGPVPTAEFFGIPVAGVLQILARYGSNSMDATATFQSNSNVVSATQVMINGIARNDFDVELAFDPAQLQQLAACLFGGAEFTFEVTSEVFQIIEDFLGGSEFTDGILAMNATSNPLRFNFTVTYDTSASIFGAGDVITGSVTYSEDPETAAVLTATVRLNHVPQSGVGRVYTSTSNPLVAFADDWGTQGLLNVNDTSITGRVIANILDPGPLLSADEPSLSCLTTTTYSNYRDGVRNSGSVAIRVSIGGVSLWAVLRGGNNEDDGFLYLNGIPIPIQLIFGILIN